MADRFDEMARELLNIGPHTRLTDTLVVTTEINFSELAAALRRVAAEENEACAQICRNLSEIYNDRIYGRAALVEARIGIAARRKEIGK